MDSSLEERRARRAGAVTRKIRLHDDHEAFDRDVWREADPADRAAAVFALSVLAARVRGFDGHQLRLQRSVACSQRCGG